MARVACDSQGNGAELAREALRSNMPLLLDGGDISGRALAKTQTRRDVPRKIRRSSGRDGLASASDVAR